MIGLTVCVWLTFAASATHVFTLAKARNLFPVGTTTRTDAEMRDYLG